MSAVDVRNISRWKQSQLEEELRTRTVVFESGSTKAELVLLLVNSIASELLEL